MRFAEPLQPATLLRRRQRFFADVRDAAGQELTVLCANTGRMLGYSQPGMRIWLSPRPPGSRHAWRWELSEVAGALVCAHPHHAVNLVLEAVGEGRLAELEGYAGVRREVRYGREGSRVDLLLESPGRPPCFVEVKAVTAADEFGLALFPDAVSTRAARHMRELAAMRAEGARSVVVFVVQRSDALALRTASEIDPAYAAAFRTATSAGVETLVLGMHVKREGITFERRLALLR
ncbi:DNA/RNA nuclease SfsA [Tahibacter amnicola]|uniref:Sugar fermentation stimulation protein homolog n=1 Tax=Tahibacter amnicola TaxID=2976241 RepID=A0ABY6BI49_9GAMM|nr:DNA/RNA nuclease SfsA [Tahibacter amnicola]UXI68035.1 DNA/RNA nuclease SfsA [Tahibacter amnicola]